STRGWRTKRITTQATAIMAAPMAHHKWVMPYIMSGRLLGSLAERNRNNCQSAIIVASPPTTHARMSARLFMLHLHARVHVRRGLFLSEVYKLFGFEASQISRKQ